MEESSQHSSGTDHQSSNQGDSKQDKKVFSFSWLFLHSRLLFFFFLVNGAQDEEEEEEELYELRSLPNGEMSEVSSEPEEGQDMKMEAEMPEAEDEDAATVDRHKAIIEDIRWRLIRMISAVTLSIAD